MRSVPFLCPTNAFVLFYYQLFSLRFVRFDCEFIQCWWPLFAFSLIKYIYIFRFLLTMYVHTHIYTQLWDMCNNFFFFLSLLFFFMFLFMLLLYSIHHHFIVCTVNDIWVQLLQSLNGRLFFCCYFLFSIDIRLSFDLSRKFYHGSRIISRSQLTLIIVIWLIQSGGLFKWPKRSRLSKHTHIFEILFQHFQYIK